VGTPVAAVPPGGGSGTEENVFGSFSRAQWLTGQPITKARPTTRFCEIVPRPGWSVW
jgi:hypothetical protein